MQLAEVVPAVSLRPFCSLKLREAWRFIFHLWVKFSKLDSCNQTGRSLIHAACFGSIFSYFFPRDWEDATCQKNIADYIWQPNYLTPLSGPSAEQAPWMPANRFQAPLFRDTVTKIFCKRLIFLRFEYLTWKVAIGYWWFFDIISTRVPDFIVGTRMTRTADFTRNLTLAALPVQLRKWRDPITISKMRRCRVGCFCWCRGEEEKRLMLIVKFSFGDFSSCQQHQFRITNMKRHHHDIHPFHQKLNGTLPTDPLVSC